MIGARPPCSSSRAPACFALATTCLCQWKRLPAASMEYIHLSLSLVCLATLAGCVVEHIFRVFHGSTLQYDHVLPLHVIILRCAARRAALRVSPDRGRRVGSAGGSRPRGEISSVRRDGYLVRRRSSAKGLQRSLGPLSSGINGASWLGFVGDSASSTQSVDAAAAACFLRLGRLGSETPVETPVGQPTGTIN